MATFFGFAWANRTTHVAPLAPYCNLYTVVPESLTASIGSFLATLNTAGMQALVALQSIVCDMNTGLRLPNWSAQLDQWKAAQGTAIDTRVMAFYLPDEPYHHGWSAAQVLEVSARVKLLWPAHRQMLIEGYQLVRDLGTPTYPIPPHVHYVGFDRYGTIEPHTDQDYAADYNALKARLGPFRKMVVVGESQWMQYYEDNYPNPPYNFGKEKMGPICDSYAIVAQRPEVAVLIMYAYPNGFAGQADFIGAEGLPASVKARHSVAGKAITGKQF